GRGILEPGAPVAADLWCLKGVFQGRLISLPNTARLLGVCINTVLRLVRDGDFPQPIRLGPRATFYDRREVVAWADFKMHTRGEIRRSPGRQSAE
ncbi:AlpA family phage regulatory protein, partial [Xanthomonas nasturtii]